MNDFTIEVTASGDTLEDALTGLDEARKQIVEGHLSGCSSHGSGSYGYDVEEPLGVTILDPDQAPAEEADRVPVAVGGSAVVRYEPETAEYAQ